MGPYALWPMKWLKAPPPLPKTKKLVYCKECKYFHRRVNDWYYMNDVPFPENPIPQPSRQSDMKWTDQCLHPNNHKEEVTYRDTYAEREEIRMKNTRRPSTINMYNDCGWYKSKRREPSWEK